ncbi:MAG: FixH family protein [Ignavibacteria bacterium]|nr:FixH family protein [Ignavibacteria bacterium]
MKKLHWGWRIGIVYTLFASATLGFVAFALTTSVDLVRPDYYEESLRHDVMMADRSRAEASGSTLEVKSRELTLTTSMAGVPDGQIRLKFYKPDQPDLDRSLAVTADAQGIANVDLSGFATGVWKLTAQWSSKGNTYELNRTVVLE